MWIRKLTCGICEEEFVVASDGSVGMEEGAGMLAEQLLEHLHQHYKAGEVPSANNTEVRKQG